MAAGPEPTKIELYLGYLKLEMSIMGILSTFCIAALALILKESAGAEKGSHLESVWKGGAILICHGTILLLAAALAFYRQRSLLAYYYGLLCLSEASVAVAGSSREEILKEADQWSTWRYYRLGFAALVAAMAMNILALLKPLLGWHFGNCGMTVCAVVVLAAVGSGFGYFEWRLSKQ